MSQDVSSPLLLRYLLRVRHESPQRFMFRWCAIGLAFQIAINLLVGLLSSNNAPTNSEVIRQQLGVSGMIFNALLFAPIFETLLYQSAIISLCLRIGAGEGISLFASTVIFAAAHATYGMTAVLLQLPFGAILGWSYLIWRRKSQWVGIYTTAGIHLFRNLFGVICTIFVA